VLVSSHVGLSIFRKLRLLHSIRVLATILVAMLVFVPLADVGNRGFLKSSRREIWLHALPAGASGEQERFEFASFASPEEIPNASRAGSFVVGLQESSMGRTGVLGSEWRASNWIVIGLVDASGRDVHYSFEKPLAPASLAAALDRYVTREIIPGSPAMAFWPTVAPGPVRHDGSPRWWVWQKRDSPLTLVGTLFISLAAGFLASSVLCAVIRRKSP
jgi:hypothetical protein